MRVAVTILGNEISPRFDCAREILLADIGPGKILEWRILEMKERNPICRIKSLSAWKVQQVICGGIDDFSIRMLNGLGIRVSAWISGNAHEALKEFSASLEREGTERKRKRCNEWNGGF